MLFQKNISLNNTKENFLFYDIREHISQHEI